MRIGNYEHQMTIALTPAEHAKLGKPAKFDVKFLHGTGGFVSVAAGNDYKSYEGSAEGDLHLRIRIPNYTVKPLGLKFFGSQDVQTSEVNGKLIGAQPDTGRELRKRRRYPSLETTYSPQKVRKMNEQSAQAAAQTQQQQIQQAEFRLVKLIQEGQKYVENINQLVDVLGDAAVLSLDGRYLKLTMEWGRGAAR